MTALKQRAAGHLKRRFGLGGRCAPRVWFFLLSSVGLALSACSPAHRFPPPESAGTPTEEGSQSESAPSAEAAFDDASAPSMESEAKAAPAAGAGVARPATGRPRKLAQASAPGRALTTTGAKADVPAPPVGDGPVLIYTAQLTMAIFEVTPTQAKIEALVATMGGFLAQKTNDAITVRVPAPRFHEAIAGIEKIGDVTRRNISAEDVSQEFFDLEVRIKSARAVRERLEHLLGRAVKVEDALGIERELDRVVAEIERLEGRLKFLQGKAQYSTITVTFAAQPKEIVTKGRFKLPFPWLDELGLSRLLDLEH